MSGIASGIGTVFKAVGSTASKISSSVVGIGKAAFTAGAATGATSMASGGLNGVIQSVTGQGVLGNVLTGAVKQAAVGAALGAATGAITGQGVGKGALIGGLTGGIAGGFGSYMDTTGLETAATTPAATPTGFAPTGVTDAKAATDLVINDSPANAMVSPAAPATPATSAPAATGVAAGFKGLLDNEMLMGALGGLGEGLMKQQEINALRDERQADRDWRDGQQTRITDSYNVDQSARKSQHPAAQSGPRAQAGLPFFNYNNRTGEFEVVA